jgi:Ni/Fe-hydrogenase b-type cytochrome subunit
MANGEDEKTPAPQTPRPVRPNAGSASLSKDTPGVSISKTDAGSQSAIPQTADREVEKAAPVEAANPMPAADAEPAPEKKPEVVHAAEVRAAYEHPFAIRLTHWVNAVSVFVLVTSGLRIFRAFPSFGPKIPEQDLIDIPKAITLGGWLGGALQWHFTFMWLFAASGVVYLSYQLFNGHYRTVLFTPKDIPGVWPMARHYFFFGPKPPVTEQYNPLQKLAYTSTVGFGVLSLLTGLVLYKPAQFSWLAFLFGGFHLTRIWHFASMCGFVSFIPGHLIMVALHGWSNFYSMLSGWKREPEYQD